jgi:hypothetical protein
MIRLVKIQRFCFTPHGVFGQLSTDGFGCFTLEEPWNDNKTAVSCIPGGVYVIKRDTFKGIYPNFRLLSVPGRTDIEIHRGNSENDTRGCILLGDGYAIDYDTTSYLLRRSTVAMDKFMAAMEGIDEAILVVNRAI